MNEYILKSEVTEHISNRQTAKILFLQQELAQAQDQIKDLEYMLKLNKEALRLSIEEKEDETRSPEFMGLQKLNKENAINSYYMEENKRLNARIESLLKERNLAQSKVLFIWKRLKIFLLLRL